jgi:hypothetical protein
MPMRALFRALLVVSTINATAAAEPASDPELRAAESRYFEAIRKIDADAAAARGKEFEKLRETYRTVFESRMRGEPYSAPPEREPSPEPIPQPAPQAPENKSIFTDPRLIWSIFEGEQGQILIARIRLVLLACLAVVLATILAILAAARRRVLHVAPEFCHGDVKVRLGTYRVDPQEPKRLIATRRGSIRFSLREPWLVRVSFNVFFRKSGRHILCCHWGLRQWDLIGVHGIEHRDAGTRKPHA